MNDQPTKSKWHVPFDSPLSDEPARRKREKVLRVAIYVAIAAAMIVPTIQFQAQTHRNLRRSAKFDAKHPDWTPAVAQAVGLRRPKAHKGAIGRWSKAVRKFWAGENIYLSHEEVAELEALDTNPNSPKRTRLHPNMPFVIILLTPFAYVPPELAAIMWNVLKLLSLVASIWMVADLAGHGRRRVVDWVIALGLAWSLLMFADDFLHGNTNTFVLAAVVCHLWLFRRGKDWLAGLPLALAICIKMTPAIFVLYWLYQRNWKLLAGTAIAMVLLAVILPAAIIGPSHYATLTQSWLDNLIIPGLVKGAWYPIHINQSISGVFSRYFFAEGNPNGNLFWSPDDTLYEKQTEFAWITLVSLSESTVKMLVKLSQLAVVVAVGWAIGWRKLPRDDGRRLLHYGLVVTALLLLNQRTWEHHATVLLIAGVAIWQAVAFGKFSRAVRIVAMAIMLATGCVLFFTTSDMVEMVAKLLGCTDDQGEITADVVKAYGPMFYHLVGLLVVGVLLSVVLRRCKDDVPYATERQKLSG